MRETPPGDLDQKVAAQSSSVLGQMNEAELATLELEARAESAARAACARLGGTEVHVIDFDRPEIWAHSTQDVIAECQSFQSLDPVILWLRNCRGGISAVQRRLWNALTVGGKRRLITIVSGNIGSAACDLVADSDFRIGLSCTLSFHGASAMAPERLSEADCTAADEIYRSVAQVGVEGVVGLARRSWPRFASNVRDFNKEFGPPGDGWDPLPAFVSQPVWSEPIREHLITALPTGGNLPPCPALEHGMTEAQANAAWSLLFTFCYLIQATPSLVSLSARESLQMGFLDEIVE